MRMRLILVGLYSALFCSCSGNLQTAGVKPDSSHPSAYLADNILKLLATDLGASRFATLVMPGLASGDSTGSSQRSLIVKEYENSILFNQVCSNDRIWSAGNGMVWDLYKTTLSKELVPLSADDSARLLLASRYFNDIRPAYDYHKTEYLQTLENASMPETDSGFRDQKIAIAYSDWLAYGHKLGFDHQIGLISMIYGKSSIAGTHDLLQAMERYYRTNPVNDGGYYFTDVFGQHGAWTTVSVDSTYVSPGSPSGHLLIRYTARFDIMRVTIVRPWLQPGLLSDGSRTAGDDVLRKTKGYPVQVIYGRNIRCEKWKTGVLIPGRRQGHYRIKKAAKSCLGLYVSEGKQIIGFICDRI